MKDRYDNTITTNSQIALDLYVEGLDLFLAGQPGFLDVFENAAAEDPGFALGFVGLARGHQFSGDLAKARDAMSRVGTLTKGLTTREQSHVNIFNLLIEGKVPAAYAAIRAHVLDHPRDAMVAQTCSSPLGLIGLSGLPGREPEILAYTASLAPHYGEDWWWLSQYAFALSENGNQIKASELIERSLALNPKNANGAHVQSHVYYESGEETLGLRFLDDWLSDYDSAGYLHGHLVWHSGLWSLEQGDIETMWRNFDASIKPGTSKAIPMLVLADAASLLYRTELAGFSVGQERWAEISAYASRYFPTSTIGFADLHAAVSHAMAGNYDGVDRLVASPNPLTGDLVSPIAEGLAAISRGKWAKAVKHLSTAMADHARLGGSRAQRDLLEYSLLSALLKLGMDDEARRLLALRRPALANTKSLHSLNTHQNMHTNLGAAALSA